MEPTMFYWLIRCTNISNWFAGLHWPFLLLFFLVLREREGENPKGGGGVRGGAGAGAGAGVKCCLFCSNTFN